MNAGAVDECRRESRRARRQSSRTQQRRAVRELVVEAAVDLQLEVLMEVVERYTQTAATNDPTEPTGGTLSAPRRRVSRTLSAPRFSLCPLSCTFHANMLALTLRRFLLLFLCYHRHAPTQPTFK